MAAPILNDLDLTKLNISPDDKPLRKLMMLIEGTYGMGIQASIKKYTYSEQRYHQLLRDFKNRGMDALIDRKRGPKSKHVRDETVMNQVIRQRFLDPEASADVIAQRLRQIGLQVSVRSVERTITEYGLQKKTPSITPG